MNFKKLKRGSVLLLLVFLLSACEQQRARKQYPLHYSDAIMGTSFTIKVPALPRSTTGDELKNKIKVLLDRLNSQLST